MSKPFSEMDTAEKKMCREKIKWLKTIGFEALPDQPTPKLIHIDLPGEVYDVHGLNPIAMVKRIYDLGEERVNKILKRNMVVKNPKSK